MNRERALTELAEISSDIKAQGVDAMYLFGSTARGAAGAESDVDLFVDLAPGTRFNAFDLLELRAWLERRLRARVDLTTREGLHPRLRRAIEDEALRVF